jgi:hypothetical protein
MIDSTPRRAGPYSGNGVTTGFAFAFRVFDTSDVLVEVVLADGSSPTLVEDTDYSVTLNADQTASPGGSVTYPLSGSPLTADDVITLAGQLPYDQTLQLPLGGNFHPTAIETGLDRLSIQIQQVAEALGRTFSFPLNEGAIPSFPSIVDRAGKLLGFDDDGNFIGVVPVPGDASAVTTDLATSSNTAKGDALIAAKATATGAQATTLHQVIEEDRSVFRFFTPTQIAAVIAEAGGSSAIVTTALQSMFDGVRSGGTLGGARLPLGIYMLDAPVRVKNGTPRVTLVGDNRIRTILMPNAADIKASPVNVNALIVVQDNNAHLCVEKLRMTASAAYTGVGVYCKEGGGGDATGQALFSALFRDLWVDFPTTNTGFLTGATQNSVFDTITFENMKGVFTLEGAGSGDNFYRNIAMSSCYDQFILQTADTNGSFAMSVDGLHAYQHYRGRLFDVKNWIGGNINDVTLEPITGNLGTTGLFKFKDCTALLISNFYALARTDVPACATGIELDTTAATGTLSAKFLNGAINADIGCKITGTGTHNVEFVNVDFTTCATAALSIAAGGGGTITTRGCKFNDSTIHGFVNTVGSSHNWYSHGDEFLNAGLGGNASSRNIALETSGVVKLYYPRIGRNNGSAAAGYFMQANGGGTVDIYDPEWVGTPPSGLIDPSGTQQVTIHRSQPSGSTTVTGATYTVLETDRWVTANRAGTVTLTLPAASSYIGREIGVRTVTANTVVSASSNVSINNAAAGTPILAATAGKWATLVSDGGNWHVQQTGG